MRTAKAFCPGHITGFFSIFDEHTDPMERGSQGAGLCLDKGATSIVTVRPASRPISRPNSRPVSVRSTDVRPITAEPSKDASIQITINGQDQVASVTRMAMESLVAMAKIDNDPLIGNGSLIGNDPFKLEVDITLDLPQAQGLGMSAAGTLSAALAAAKVLDLEGNQAELALNAAHLAEVENRTGLGDAVASAVGGFGVLEREGVPPLGRIRKLPWSKPVLLCFVGRELHTRSILEDEVTRGAIMVLGLEAMERFIKLPDPIGLMLQSWRFARETGLATQDILLAVSAVQQAGGRASMSMLGHTVFAIPERTGEHVLEDMRAALEPYGDTLVCGVDQDGARLVGD